MSGKNVRVRRAYRFFCESERKSKGFTLEDVASATGWSINTVRSYVSKKWHFIIKPSSRGYVCEGVCSISEDAFVRLHAQRVPLIDEILRPRFSPTIDALIDKSREATLLAIQIYNNPLVTFRTPGYIVHLVIAYTALFHALFERDGIDHWYLDSYGKPKLADGDYKYWELMTCLKEYYRGITTPETENLRLLAGLRNKIEHRFLPALDIHISGFCQAALLNYERLLVGEFGSYFSLRNNLMLALQITEFSDELNESLRNFQASQYDVLKRYIEDFCRPLSNEIVHSPSFSFRAFLIPKIGNHASSSDIALEFIKFDPTNDEDMKQYEKQVALIKEKRVQVADQGKYLPSDVIREVRKITGINFKMYDHTRSWKYYQVRTSDEDPSQCKIKYCQYNEPFKQIIYTDAWIDFLSEKIQDSAELERIRAYRD